MQSRNLLIPGVQGVMMLEGSSTVSVRVVEEVVHPAGCSTTARAQEDGPVIWEALPVLHGSDSGAGRPERGEPELGREAEQGVGGPNMSVDLGEREAPGPGRAKAARADVSFRRAT
jgi:hypothetical protein